MVQPFGPPRPLEATPRRLDRLTSLRWFAAMAVFFVHGYQLVRVAIPWYAPSSAAGSFAGVSFFFMLSGFVLAWSRSDRAGVRPFLQNRLARIWPSHIAAEAAAWLLQWRVFALAQAVTVTVPVVFLVQAWIPSSRWYFAQNTPSWTLACEAFFYLMFPWLHRRIDAARRPVALLVGLLAAIWAVPLLTLPMSKPWWIWSGYIFPLPRLMEFAVGIVLCRMVREGRLRWTNPVPPAILVGVAIWTERWLPVRIGFVALAAVPLAWLLAASGAGAVSGRPSVLDARPFVWLGEISFAFYLTHALVLVYSYQIFSVLRHGWISHARPLLGVELVMSVVAAWIVHRVVEVPFERLLRARRAAHAESIEDRAVPAGVS